MANFFTDRSVENPGRYRLNPTGISEVYDLTREEGTIYNQGTPLNAENLNDAMQDVIDQIPTDYVTRDDLEADIDTTASAGTTDGDLYNAINSVGWASNVISGSNLLIKKLLTKLIDKPSHSTARVFADAARGWQWPFVLCLHQQGCLRRGVRASGPSQGRTGESGAFGMWPHPRGSSRISS